jgi:hypothetical protein
MKTLQFEIFFTNFVSNKKTVEIRNKELIEKFVKEHADAKDAFQRWIDIVEDAE